uniref:Kazal-like domain-containing protein n=1 Tax=Laticauda laticaudata TaxID=8630 RepID=A0A8C5RA54_LATLA
QLVTFLCSLSFFFSLLVCTIFYSIQKIHDHDQDPQCNLQCSRTAVKPLCASDGRTYESMCDYQRAKCKDSNLNVAHRGRCKGKELKRGTSLHLE